MTLIYLVGFTKSIMVVSATVMIGLILQEDIQQKSTLRTIVQNIPSRCKIVMEQQFPFLKRFNFNDNIAVGMVGVLLILTIQSVFFTTSTASTTAKSSSNNNP